MPKRKQVPLSPDYRADWITDKILNYYKNHSARETCEHFGIEFNGTRQYELSITWAKQDKVKITPAMLKMYLAGATWREVAQKFDQKQNQPFRRALVKAAQAKKGKGQWDRKLIPITDEMMDYYRNYTFLETCQKFGLPASKGLQNRFAKLGKDK